MKERLRCKFRQLNPCAHPRRDDEAPLCYCGESDIVRQPGVYKRVSEARCFEWHHAQNAVRKNRVAFKCPSVARLLNAKLVSRRPLTQVNLLKEN